MIARPSGLVVDNATWVRQVSESLIVKRLGLPYPDLRVHSGAEEKPARSYQNPTTERVEIAWEETWDQYAEGLLTVAGAGNPR